MKKGFTLLELSIVLVIIGLLAGAVMVGRDLIEASQIRKTINTIDSFKAAAQTFKAKYNCLPGDCPNAIDFGFATSGGPGDGGNGDGAIGGTIVNVVNEQGHESYNFWYHLSQAKLLAGSFSGFYPGAPWPVPSVPGVDMPSGGIPGSGIWVSRPDYIDDNGTIIVDTFENSFWLMGEMTSADGGGADINPRPALTPTQNYAIDSKIDDGMPLTGKVTLSIKGNYFLDIIRNPGSIIFGMVQGIYGTDNAALSDYYCGDSSVSPPRYNIDQKELTPDMYCILQVNAGF